MVANNVGIINLRILCVYASQFIDLKLTIMERPHQQMCLLLCAIAVEAAVSLLTTEMEKI